MHTLAVYMAPVMAAEKSKVPYYIAGSALVAWALIVSLGLGLRRPQFPGSQAGQRAVIAVSVVLVATTLSMAVITAGTPAKSSASSSSTPASPAAPPPPTSPATSPAPPAAAPSHSLQIAANPTGLLAYNTKQLSAAAGKVTVTMTNMSPLAHNFTLAQGTKLLGAIPTFVGGSRTLAVTLKPGTYTFYCSVPGHRQAGMEGTLTVS